MTKFQSAALRAIAHVGSVYVERDDIARGVDRFGYKMFGEKCVTKQGERIAISADDGTYGYIGAPTLAALLYERKIVRDGNCYSMAKGE